jgi:hypothetical protein
MNTLFLAKYLTAVTKHSYVKAHSVLSGKVLEIIHIKSKL